MASTGNRSKISFPASHRSWVSGSRITGIRVCIFCNGCAFVENESKLSSSRRRTDLHRGRDIHCGMPPAQIPAGGIHAPGSHLGWLTPNPTSIFAYTVEPLVHV